MEKGEKMPDIQSMIGTTVEVVANGTKYTGLLIEVSDAEVHLKTALQWISLPSSSVSSITLKDAVTHEPEREGIQENEG
jgi:hypothetical protein